MDTSVKTLTMLSIEPGTVVAGRYEVREKVGSGGMGMVFRVFDRHLNDDQVALKLLHPHLAEDADVFQRFRNEVLVARSLSHPNIIRLHDIGQAEQGFFYISMEYVDGYSLKDRMVDGGKVGLPPWDFEEALQTFYQICCAVSYAHSKGIIHRDLKPANVMISKSNDIKLGDFGTARIVGLSRNFTQTGQVIGTPDYMAPEQIQGHPLDAKCDIYALGIIGYELATGEKPFNADSAVALAFKHISEPLPRFASKERGIPEWYEGVIRKAAEKDKEQRFASVAEMVRAIIEYRPDLSTTGTLFFNEPKKAKVEVKQNTADSGRFELGEIKPGASDDRRPGWGGAGWSVGGQHSGQYSAQHRGQDGGDSAAAGSTPRRTGFLFTAGVLLVIAGVVGVLAANPRLLHQLQNQLSSAVSSAPVSSALSGGSENVANRADDEQRMRDALGGEVFGGEALGGKALGGALSSASPVLTPPPAVSSVEVPAAVESAAVSSIAVPSIVGPSIVGPSVATQSGGALSVGAQFVGDRATNNPMAEPPAAVEALSVQGLQLREAGQGKVVRSIELGKLSGVEWRAAVAGFADSDEKVLRDRVKKEFKARITKLRGGELVGVIGAQYYSRTAVGDVQIGGKFSGVVTGKISTGEFKLELLHVSSHVNAGGHEGVDEVASSTTFDIYRVAAEGGAVPSTGGTVSVVTDSTLGNQGVGEQPSSQLSQSSQPSQSLQLPPAANNTPPVVVAPSGAENFRGSVEVGSGQKNLTLSITIADNKITGQATIDGLGDFNVQGDMFPRGFEMALRNSQMGIRLSGSRSGSSLRGRYYNSTTQERGTWEVNQ